MNEHRDFEKFIELNRFVEKYLPNATEEEKEIARQKTFDFIAALIELNNAQRDET